MTAIDNGYSDHSILTANYHIKALISTQKLIKTRPSYLLTDHLLNQYIENNDTLQTIFNYTCPNLIANIIISELNGIINIIAPSKIVQVRKNYILYMNEDLIQRQQTKTQLYNKAKMTGSTSDCTNIKNHKTTLVKDITNRQKQYINDKLNNTTDRWKTLKDINKTNKSDPPGQ